MTARGRAVARLLAEDVISSPLEHALVQASDVLAGQPTVGTVALMADLDCEIGIWEVTPGFMTDVESDEAFVVLAGRGRVDFEDGTSVELSPGTVVRLRAGDRTEWTVIETLRKIYFLLPERDPKEKAR